LQVVAFFLDFLLAALEALSLAAGEACETFVAGFFFVFVVSSDSCSWESQTEATGQ
jgi:hypothetical protein